MPADDNLTIREADPGSPGCQAMIRELDALQGSLYSVEENYLDSIGELQKPNCYFVGAYLGNKLVGCGALKMVDGIYAEIKRMYVAEECRQRGIGQRILDQLEKHGVNHGVRIIRLETGRRQPEALALYRGNGYREIEAFGHYSAGASNIFMEKLLPDG